MTNSVNLSEGSMSYDPASGDEEDLFLTPMNLLMREIVRKVKSMSPEEFKASLIEAGIITAGGELTPPYRSPTPRRRKPKST